MNGSPNPSAPAGLSSPPMTVEIPDGMFFDAGDYNLGNTHPALLEATRFKVARHRSKLKASIALLLEDSARINSSLHAADRQGNAAPHWDSAVTLVAKLQKAVAHLADQLDKAECRYEESQLAPSAPEIELPAVATPANPLPGGKFEAPDATRVDVNPINIYSTKTSEEAAAAIISAARYGPNDRSPRRGATS